MELLVCLADSTSTDPLRHPVLPKAGDVIHTQPDGSGWGREDLRNPAWMVIRVKGMTADEGNALIAGELPQGMHAHEYLIRYRGMRLDVAVLGLRPGDRGGFSPDVELDVDVVRSAMQLKDPLPHPDLIGPVTPHTIG